jgi:hypothetical protein
LSDGWRPILKKPAEGLKLIIHHWPRHRNPIHDRDEINSIDGGEPGGDLVDRRRRKPVTRIGQLGRDVSGSDKVEDSPTPLPRWRKVQPVIVAVKSAVVV